MLTAGVCVCVGWPPGVASTFSAPYGGLLFSVEVTSTYYLIKQLPQSLFADLGGAVVVKVIGLLGTVALFSTNFSAKTQVKTSLHQAAHTHTHTHTPLSHNRHLLYLHFSPAERVFAGHVCDPGWLLWPSCSRLQCSLDAPDSASQVPGPTRQALATAWRCATMWCGFICLCSSRLLFLCAAVTLAVSFVAAITFVIAFAERGDTQVVMNGTGTFGETIR